jgi:hypothetical protein
MHVVASENSKVRSMLGAFLATAIMCGAMILSGYTDDAIPRAFRVSMPDAQEILGLAASFLVALCAIWIYGSSASGGRPRKRTGGR